MRLPWLLARAAAAVLLLGTSVAAQAADDVCDDDGSSWLEGTQLLRAISLDLRGVVPSMDEYARVEESGGEIPDDLIDEWLASEAFAERAIRHHQALIWNNLAGTRYFGNNARLYVAGGRFYRRTLALRRRGDYVPCGDWENTLDEFGRPAEIRTVGGLKDDGWIWVTPYWDPDRPRKVCTLDALSIEVTARGTDCLTTDGLYDPDCGCGPDLAWCAGGGVEEAVNEGLREDIDRRIRKVVLEDRPYTELLTGNTAWVNGPVVHYLKNMARVNSRLRMNRLPYDLETLPDLEYTDVDDFVEIGMGPEQSGILTSPAFLIRFQTNRARANRFYSAFMCTDFQAPPGGLPTEDGVPTLDLTARDGCKYCHAILEPTAAHWGRWTQTGASYLDPAEFPAFDEACARCGAQGIGCDAECRAYYVTDPLTGEEEPYMGWLTAYEFLEERHHHHPDEGPSLLVRQGIVDGRLPSCVAQKASEALLGRELTGEDDPWLDGVTATLEGNDWSYREMVKAIVTSPNYRRLP